MSTGIGYNATSSTALPLLQLPTSAYLSGSCSVFATPVVAQATGVSTIFTLFAAQSIIGANFLGLLLAVYPDAGGAPGWPPLFDGLLSAAMCWQQPLGTSNASQYGYSGGEATWPDQGTVMCNITGGVGLFGFPNPQQYPP